MRQLALLLFRPVESPLRFAVITALLTFTTFPLMAQEQPIPAELSFLNKIDRPYRTPYEPWTELQILQGNRGMGGVGKVARGKHCQFPVIAAGVMTDDAVWAIIRPTFIANGWTAVHEWSAGGIELFLHYQKDGVEAWAETDLLGAERASVDMIEIAPIPFTFTLKPPAAAPEAVSTNAGDFPWLGPQPGLRFRSGDYEVHSIMGYGF